jgi:hypothetical protein
MLLKGRLTPPRHSGRWVVAPVASLRCRTLRPGEASINPPGLALEKKLPERPTAGYKYSCSGSAPLAGFEVSADGRFSGVHRGAVALGCIAVLLIWKAQYQAWKEEVGKSSRAELIANGPDVSLRFRYGWPERREHEHNPLALKNQGRDVATDVKLLQLDIGKTSLRMLPVSFAVIAVGESVECIVEVHKELLSGLPGASIHEFSSFIDECQDLPLTVRVRFGNRVNNNHFVRTFSVHRDGIGGINFTPVSLDVVKDH